MDVFTLRLFIYIIIILSATLHEYAHGWMAYRLGDSTAQRAGRLTLNPIAHIDPFGTVLVPILFLFTSGIFIGWAKPVPYNPYALSDRKFGSLKIGIAGPAANLFIAITMGIFMRLLIQFGAIAASDPLLLALGFIAYVNIFLALFNLIPVPPLDGSKVFEALFPRQWDSVMRLGIAGVLIAFFIAFYFLAPVAQYIFRILTGTGL